MHQAPRPWMGGLAQNDRAFIAAIGRAPHGEDVAQDTADAGRCALVGLDVEGWLWLSILKTSACPSPMSTTPAFSPGPQITCGPVVGSVRSHRFDDLRAMLVPHRREDAELGQRRHPPDQVEDSPVLVRLQPVRGDQRIGDLGLADKDGVGHRQPRRLYSHAS